MFVELARGHIVTSLRVSANRRNEVGLRHLRSAVKQLSGLDTIVAVNICLICDRILF
jgi:hypothetical protein